MKKKLLIMSLSFFPGIIFAKNNGNDSLLQDPAVWFLSGIVVILFVTVLYLLNRSKKQPVKKVMAGNKEFTELGNAFKSLKKDYDKVKSENEELKGNIKLMKGQIEELEGINNELIVQKERLSDSEKTLKDLQKKKEDLFAIAIHDITNPISAIKSYIELLEGYDLNATEQQEIVQCLVSSTDKVLSLAREINSIVIFERADENEPKKDEKNDKAPTSSIYEIIKSVLKQNQAYAKKKSVYLVNNSSANTPGVKANPEKVEEILFNLVNNAIKFGPPETTVQVKSYFNNGYVMIEVTDDGAGIAKEDIDKAFTKGGTLTAKPTGDEKSTGLGLFSVKTIVEGFGGEVWVNSKLNLGSTFGFKLPRVKDANLPDI